MSQSIMRLVIPRGIVYHRLITDILSLIKSCFTKINNTEQINKFERQFADYLHCDHCIAFPFARTAIYSALKAQNLAASSQIIMPPITIKAILDVILELKLQPVFVDIDPDTLCFDVTQLEAAITDNTQAILITYLFGMVPDMQKLIDLCRQKKLFIIEDFSQCLNGKYNNQPVGSFGDLGIYSASSIKTLDTYGGGLAVTNNSKIASQLRSSQAALAPPSRKLLISKITTDLVRNFATQRFIFHLFTFNLIRIISCIKPGSAIKHTGDREKKMLTSLPQEWFTAYTSLQANIGMELLTKVATMDTARVANVANIKNQSNKISFPKGVANTNNVYWQLAAYFEQPLRVQKYLHQHKIDSSTTSLEKISSLAAYPIQATTPNADRLYNNGLFIPAYHSLQKSDIEHIILVLNQLG